MKHEDVTGDRLAQRLKMNQQQKREENLGFLIPRPVLCPLGLNAARKCYQNRSYNNWNYIFQGHSLPGYLKYTTVSISNYNLSLPPRLTIYLKYFV